MATITQIRQAIAAVVDNITGLNVHAHWPGQISTPAAVVRRKQTRFGVDFDGSDDSTYAVSVYVAATDPAVQDTLDAYLSTSGATSVKAILEAASPTLTGVVQFFNVESIDEEGITTISGVEYLTGTITIMVGSA
jgi:hypothetical protein